MSARWYQIPLVLGWILTATACMEGTVDDPVLQTREASGVRFVEVPHLSTMTTPRWSHEESLAIPTEGSNVDLFEVLGARLLPEGDIAVANSGMQELLVLDSAGALRSSMGGAGAGPGEFMHLSGLELDRSGNLVTHDSRLGRSTTFSPDGEVLRTQRIAPIGQTADLLPVSSLEDDRSLAIVGESRRFGLQGVIQDSTPLFVLSPEGDVLDTLGIWAHREYAYTELSGGGAMRRAVEFGRELAYGARGGFTAVGHTDSLDVTVFGPDGSVTMRIQGQGPQPIAPAKLDRWLQETVESDGGPAIKGTAASGSPFHTTYPAFGGLMIDDKGRVWIGAYPRLDELERRWIIIDQSGQLSGILDLPTSYEPLDAASGRVLVLRRDEFGVEEVAVLHVSGNNSTTRVALR